MFIQEVSPPYKRPCDALLPPLLPGGAWTSGRRGRPRGAARVREPSPFAAVAGRLGGAASPRPSGGGRGRRGVVTAKIFEYLAAGRPILAAVPSDGEAAAIVRDTNAGTVVEPDDVDAIGAALTEMVERFENGSLDAIHLSPETREQLSRVTRVSELEAVLATVA